MIYKNMVCRHGRFYNPDLTGFSSNENNWYGDWEQYVGRQELMNVMTMKKWHSTLILTLFY